MSLEGFWGEPIGHDTYTQAEFGPDGVPPEFRDGVLLFII